MIDFIGQAFLVLLTCIDIIWNYWWVFGIGFIAIIILGIIVALIPEKCENCQERGHIECTGSKELDRWQGTKKVEETLASGKTKIKHIRCTFVERRYYYKCTNCGNVYTRRVKEER